MRWTWKSRAFFSALAAAIGFTLTGPLVSAYAASDDQSRTVGELTIDYGIMPAAIVRGHPREHAENSMHGSLPIGHEERIVERPFHGSGAPLPPANAAVMGASPAPGPDYHLVVAIFNATTGVRVSNEAVVAEIFPLNTSGTMLKLGPMRIADTLTYGGFFRAPDAHHYTIRLTVQTPGKRKALTVVFQYEHH